jgi:glycosyltransferase involved in cell wall biosynthesis
VGSLIPLKQYSVFIEILGLVKKYLPEVRAALCGKGPEESALKDMIRQNDLQNNIILAGELSHREVLEYMAKSKIFLHTSSYEGICVSCIEALYAGTHVLSFVRLMNDPIPHWHILSEKYQMVDKIRNILSGPEIEYNAVKTFTIQESVQNIVQLFNYNESVIS